MSVNDSHRSGIGLLDRHVRTENARNRGHERIERASALVKQPLRGLGLHSQTKIGTVAARNIAAKRKVGHEQNAAADIAHGKIKLAVFVLEYTHGDELFAKLVHVRHGIGIEYSEINRQPATDCRNHLPVDGQRRAVNSLNNRFHTDILTHKSNKYKQTA